MFCPDCGSTVAEGKVFCGSCGARLHAAAASPAAEAAPQAPVATPAPIPARPMSLRQKLTLALVVLVAALGGVAWWWFHRPAPAYKVQDPGIYPYQELSADGKTLKWGFIDADGKVLVQPVWDAADSTPVLGQTVYCNEGFCGVLKDGKWGFIDTSGKLVIPNQFDAVGPFIEGLARVHLGNQIGYIDKTGQYVINPQFRGGGDFHGGLAAANGAGGWGFINRTGAFVINPRFGAVSTDGFSDGLAGACTKGEQSFLGVTPGKCGYVDRNGTLAIKPQFDSVSPFSEGMAAVQINNKWGYVNTSGKIVINPQFDQVTMFSGGLAVVTIAGHAGTINKQGKYVLNPGQYNLQPMEGDLQPFTRLNGSNPSIPGGYLETGLISRSGTWVISPTKAINKIQIILGSVFYANLEGHPAVISIDGKVLTGPYKGAMLNTLAQDLDNENSAIQSMHMLTGAEASYSNAYAAKGFADSLSKLGPPAAASPPDENHAGYIDATLASGTKDGYQFTVAIPAGTSTGGTNFNYQLTAKPQAGHAGRTFCADATGVVRYAAPGAECNNTSPTL